MFVLKWISVEKKWLIGTVCLFRVWQCSLCQHCILFDTVCWLRVWQCSLCQHCILFVLSIIVIELYHIYIIYTCIIIYKNVYSVFYKSTFNIWNGIFWNRQLIEVLFLTFTLKSAIDIHTCISIVLYWS